MLVAGIWKITDPFAAATRMNQALVPVVLSLPLALALGISETVAGALILAPRFRRWGAWLCGLLLIAFLVYMGINYSALHGVECNCFPWIERAVGPAFFVGDLVMLLMAVLAGLWARPSEGVRGAALILAAVVVFTGVSYGVAVTRQVGTQAPDSIVVDGQPFSLQDGRILLYFFDPECTSCLFAAQDMAGYTWSDTRVIAVPTDQPRFASQFLEDSGLNVPISSDAEKLRATFTFGDPPYAVALEDGRQIAALSMFEGDEPKATLTRIGLVE